MNDVLCSNRHYRWLRAAYRHCLRSSFGDYRMAALVVKGGSVINVGYNRMSPGALKAKEYAYINHNMHRGIHAELAAILNLSPDILKDSIIYVSGITKGGRLVKSKPCEACQRMLRRYGVKTVVYHEQDGKAHMYNVG